MSVTIRTPQESRSERLGLSIGLFCNKPRYAAKVTSSQIVVRELQQPREKAPTGLEEARAKVQAQGYNGKMSYRTRSKVTGMLAEWFTAKKSEVAAAFSTLNAAARKFTFCTLTLCATQFHDDNYIKRHGLGRFLLELKREKGVHHYFWRAEPQRNGNIHFHILFAQEIPWEFIRSTWNNILSDMGYLQIYKSKQEEQYCNGFKPSTNPNDKRTIEQQVKAWRDGIACGWTNPNSTDIHRLNKTKNAAAYVCKYVSKDSESRKIDGRIWGCSDSLRSLKTPEVGVTDDFIKCLNSAALLGDVELIEADHVAIYRGDIPTLLAWLAPELLASLELYYTDIAAWLANFVLPTTQ